MKKGSFEDLIHILFENINRIPLSFNQFRDLMDNAISFDENGIIITEDKNLLIDIPKELISYSMNHQSEEVDIETIKTYMKNSRHYSNIKNVNFGNLYLFIFHFDNKVEVEQFLLKRFDLEKDQIKSQVQYFINKHQSKNGICLINKSLNQYICCVNLKFKHIYETVYHELSHVIQNICNIRITPSTEINKNTLFNKFETLKNNLQINNDYISYLFNRYEYATHVDNLILNLFNTYKIFYSKLSLFDFYFHFVLDSIQKISSDKFLDCDFVKKYEKANDEDVEPLVMFYISYQLNLHFFEIKQTVWKSLRRKINQ